MILDPEHEVGRPKCPDNTSHRNSAVLRQASSIAKIVKPLLIVFTVSDAQPDSFRVPSSTCWMEYIHQFMELGYEILGSVVDAADFGFQRQKSHVRITFSKIGIPYSLGPSPHLFISLFVGLTCRSPGAESRGYAAAIRFPPQLPRVRSGDRVVAAIEADDGAGDVSCDGKVDEGVFGRHFGEGRA